MRNPIYRSWSLALAFMLIANLLPAMRPTAHAAVVATIGYDQQVPLGQMIQVVTRVNAISSYGSAKSRMTIKYFDGILPTVSQPDNAPVNYVCGPISCTFEWTVVNDGTFPEDGAVFYVWVFPTQQAGTYPFINYTTQTFDPSGELSLEIADAGSVTVTQN